MAEVIPHPDKERDFSKTILHLRRGSIAITTRNGEPLTDEAAVLMLEQARLIIIDQSLEE
jgi:hypothetical protein